MGTEEVIRKARLLSRRLQLTPKWNPGSITAAD
jgi:hypothetical protein